MPRPPSPRPLPPPTSITPAIIEIAVVFQFFSSTHRSGKPKPARREMLIRTTPVRVFTVVGRLKSVEVEMGDIIQEDFKEKSRAPARYLD